MSWLCMILADAAAQAPDQTVWGGAVAGGVTFAGLLAGLIYWLCMKHLPAKDKQIEGLINTFVTEIKEGRTACSEQNEKLLEQKNEHHKETMSQVNLHHQQLVARIDKHHGEHMADLQLNRHAVKDLHQLIVVSNAVLQEREKLRKKDQDEPDDGA